MSSRPAYLGAGNIYAGNINAVAGYYEYFLHFADISESVILGDSSDRWFALESQISEEIILSDQISNRSDLNARSIDLIKFSESQSGKIDGNSEISDSLSFSDEIIPKSSLVSLIAEGVVFSDQLPLVGGLSDGILKISVQTKNMATETEISAITINTQVDNGQ